MMSECLITIVMPVYNRKDIVRRTLDSFANQTFRPIKFILVDNNSADGSLEVMQRWADEYSTDDFDVTVITEKTPGAASARNAGLDLVDTPWVMFFDSDDAMAPDHVQRVHEAIISGDTDLLLWDVKIHFLDGSVAVKHSDVKHLLYDCIQHGILSSQRYACRTDMVRMAGGWDKHLSTWDDIELGTRLLIWFPEIRAKKIKGEPTVDIYESAQSISGLSFHSRAAESELAMDRISYALPASLQYIVNLKRVILAAHYVREGYNDDAKKLRSRALQATASMWHKLLLKAAYAYTAAGYRGAARLLRPLF